jgi:hypothetical protein
MWGKATLAMLVSSTSIKAANETMKAISQGLTFGFHVVAWSLVVSAILSPATRIYYEKTIFVSIMLNSVR